VAAGFRRQSGSNLLIVGRDDEEALGMMASVLVSMGAHLPPDMPSFYMLDFGAADSPYADLFSHLVTCLPNQLKIGRRRQLPEIIKELADEVQRRIDAENTNATSKFLFIYGLQRARDLRQEDDSGFSSYGSDVSAEPSLSQQLVNVLREGPEVGLHTVIWCDTATNLNRVLDRRALREFGMRVIFQMGSEDSVNLIDTPVASKLGSHRAYFYNESEGQLEKFRPYTLPSEGWLKWAGEQIRNKAGAS
jgi:hypothetical protein